MSMISRVFHWTGVDSEGHYFSDSQIEKNRAALNRQLKQKNITPIKIKFRFIITLSNKIPKKNIMDFIKQLSLLLSANINILDAIKILKKEQQHTQLKQCINNIQQKIETGHSLSNAMQTLSQHCDSHVINIIQAAEQTGKLPLLLQQLSDQLQLQYQLKKKMLASLYYPISILAVAILVSIGLLIYAIPQFKNIYASFSATLPAFTLLMIKSSDLIRHHFAFAF